MSARNRWRYYLEDAVDEWRHALAPNLLALATATAALFLAGLVLLTLQNVQDRMRGLRADVPIEIFLLDGAPPERVRALTESASALGGVRRVETVDRDAALTRFREMDPSLAAIVDELGENPLPESLLVRLEADADAAAVEAEVGEALSGYKDVVEAVRLDRAWLERVDGILGLLRWGLLALGAVVFGAVVLVIASVMRLAVYARRHEIEIMQWVGATPAFVRGPFLVAGLFQGLASAAFALIGLEFARRTLLWKAHELSPALADLLGGRPLAASGAIVLVVVGLAVTVTGAFFAVRRRI